MTANSSAVAASLLSLVGLLPAVAPADIPLPARLTQPVGAAEAWNVIRLAMANAERLFEENRVDEVKDQAVLLGPSLRLLAREGALAGRQAEAERIASEAFARTTLLVRESMAGNLEGARSVFGPLRNELARLEEVFEAGLPSTEIHSCVDHPEIAELLPVRVCPDCGKGLRPRRFPYSAVFTRNDAPSLRLDLLAPAPLRAGKANPLGVRLTLGSGAPATEADLVLSHSSRVHLLLLDEAGDDFQHLAPVPGNEPGAFTASFAPRTASSYRAWVLAIPAETRLPETLSAKLAGNAAAVPNEPRGEDGEEDGGGGLVAEREGVVVRLLPGGSGPLRIVANRTNLVRAHFAASDGTPLVRLEPLWNAFAHLTIVSRDLGTAFQVHPVGGEILSPSLRGGPDLAFKVHPPSPGRWRSYLQIRLDGRVVTFPLRFEAVE